MLSQHICFCMVSCLNKDEYSTNLFNPPLSPLTNLFNCYYGMFDAVHNISSTTVQPTYLEHC